MACENQTDQNIREAKEVFAYSNDPKPEVQNAIQQRCDDKEDIDIMQLSYKLLATVGSKRQMCSTYSFSASSKSGCTRSVARLDTGRLDTLAPCP